MEQSKIETAKMIMSFYNAQAGTSFRIGDNEEKAQIVMDAVERVGGLQEIKRCIREYVVEHPEDSKERPFRTFFSVVGGAYDKKPEPQPVATSEVSQSNLNMAMDILGRTVNRIIAETQTEKIEQQIMASVEDKVRAFIEEEYGHIERKITTVVDGVPRDMQGITHEMFETVLKFVANDEPVFLVGPAGSGKNVLCKQVAQALGLDFYFSNAVTQEYKLTGFTDAMGNYQETQFYKAFTQGGVFMLDEMDASIPEVLVILNAAIANRYFDFPAPIGYVEAHPNFRVIAAGNTSGYGADYEYVGRNQLDAASLDRFAIVNINYSEAIENNVAGDSELADFCRAFRNAASEVGVKIVVSYRAIGRLSKMMNLLDVRQAIETCLVKGLVSDDIRMILTKMSGKTSKYTTALEQIMMGRA